MAGSHHTGRRSWRPSTVRGRNMVSMLDGRRQAEADLRRVLYVRPYGYGFHVVKNLCNDEEYVVADGLGFKRTFAPGTVVMLGSQTGHPGEMMISGPPSGMGGASAFPVTSAVRSGYGPTPPTPEPDPVYTPGEVSVWYDGSTMYAAWDAVDGDLNAYVQIGTFSPEYIAAEPANLDSGNERSTIPGDATVLYTIPDADLAPAYTSGMGLFYTDGTYALVQSSADTMAVIDLSDGSVVSAIDTVAFSQSYLHVATVNGSRLLIYAAGDLYVYDWPGMTSGATISAPTQANTDYLGFAYHASGCAYFRKGDGVAGREKVYRWVYDTDLSLVSGPTLYSITGSNVVAVDAAYVTYSAGSYLVPVAFGAGTPTYGYLSINSAHNAQVTLDATWWADDHVPTYAWLDSVPAGSPVSGTEPVDPTYVVHRISDGVNAFVELVEPQVGGA